MATDRKLAMRNKRERHESLGAITGDSSSNAVARESRSKSKRAKLSHDSNEATFRRNSSMDALRDARTHLSAIDPYSPDKPRSPFYHPSRELLEQLVSKEIRSLKKMMAAGFKNDKLERTF
jgi:hypothetical protein